jgi:hypothetical protein
MGVNMNTQNSTNKEEDQVTFLLILHKQAKFLVAYSYKYILWAFFIVNNVDISNVTRFNN